MPLTVILLNNLAKVDRQIKALKAIIPKDTPRDRVFHELALRKLEAHREYLLLKYDYQENKINPLQRVQ
jgi:hypothetical protein